MVDSEIRLNNVCTSMFESSPHVVELPIAIPIPLNLIFPCILHHRAG